ncbi:hypothetical protein BVX94_01275 [bacterium B17]|nr:hypothetical protein BVX94_01275 [bacterium B17]
MKTTVLLFITALTVSATYSAEPFPNANFQDGTFTNWKTEGNAFAAPAEKFNERRQRNIKLPAGIKFLANSYVGKKGERALGTVTSEPFELKGKYLTFEFATDRLQRPGTLAVNLIIAGKIVRQAFPPKAGKDCKLRKAAFDIQDLQKKKAQLQIFDRQQLQGGWIIAGNFQVEDEPGTEMVIRPDNPNVERVKTTRKIKCVKRYLNIPAVKQHSDDVVKLIVDGRVVQEIQMAVARKGEKSQFWQFIDLDLWKGKKATVEFDGWSSFPDPIETFTLNDEILGFDNDLTKGDRPQLRFTVLQGWNNDVNGTVYYDGEYHLFYQHDPSRNGRTGSNMHWGHAVSKDLVHWKHLPIALGVTRKRGQNYSGSAIVDKKNVSGLQKGKEKPILAFYTRRYPSTFLGWPFDVQSSHQCIAYSNDRGRTWTHVEKPVVPQVTLKNRDPKVFYHEESKRWLMAFFNDHSGYDFYSSENLLNWKKESTVKGFNECPDMFKLQVDQDPKNENWLLVNGNGEYALGDFDGKEFNIKFRSRVVHGSFHATQTFANAPDGTKRRVQMAWFRTTVWGGMPFTQRFTLPIELTLRTTKDGVRLFAEHAREMNALRKESKTFSGKKFGAESVVIAKKIDWVLIDVEIEIDPGKAEKIDLQVRDIKYQFDAQQGKFTGASLKNFIVGQTKDGKYTLRIILDNGSQDTVVNYGEVYTMAPGPNNIAKPLLTCSATGGEASISALKVHHLKSIWEK